MKGVALLLSLSSHVDARKWLTVLNSANRKIKDSIIKIANSQKCRNSTNSLK